MSFCPECGEDKAAHITTTAEHRVATVQDHLGEKWLLTQYTKPSEGITYPMLRSTDPSEDRWVGCCVASGSPYVEEWLTMGLSQPYTVLQEDPEYPAAMIIATDSTL